MTTHTTPNSCLIPDGQALIFNFPAGAGGKMLQNCVGLSRHCVLNKKEYISWQLRHPSPVGTDFYEQKLQWVLKSIPTNAKDMQYWVGFEIDQDDPHGIGIFDFRKQIPVANPDIYQLAKAGLWCTLTVHNFVSSEYYLDYWPTVKYVTLVNNETFARPALAKKNKSLAFDDDWATKGRTPTGIGFDFDIDSCIYSTELFVQQVGQLYNYLNFDDFDPDYIARYHRRYIEMH